MRQEPLLAGAAVGTVILPGIGTPWVQGRTVDKRLFGGGPRKPPEKPPEKAEARNSPVENGAGAAANHFAMALAT